MHVLGYFTDEKISPTQTVATHFHAFLCLRRPSAMIGTNNFPETERKIPNIAGANEQEI